jgi:hypothetical protein
MKWWMNERNQKKKKDFSVKREWKEREKELHTHTRPYP